MRRLLALLLVTLGLAPGTWWRSPVPPEDLRPIVSFTPIEIGATDLGSLEMAGAWEMRSRNPHFGSYSALVALGDETLLATSDRGRMLRFSPPGAPSRQPQLDYFAGRRTVKKSQADIEALARDPATGTIWAAFEVSNRIQRYDPAFRGVAAARPAAMRNWRKWFGAEAMARLADGRFIVIAEGAPSWFGNTMPGLLFPSDPVAGAVPKRFRFIPPDGFRPVEIAQLPDGQVLILLREAALGIPPAFSGKLMIADPASIRVDQPWRAELVANLVDPLPTDNYEGMAVEPDSRGGAVLWLISDDNEMALQRTLLLKLLWRPNAKARGPGRALR